MNGEGSFMKYSNFDLERERAEQNGTEFIFGALSEPCLAYIPESERETYLPQGELQKGIEDFMDCATRSPLNILETKFNWLIRE